MSKHLLGGFEQIGLQVFAGMIGAIKAARLAQRVYSAYVGN